MDVDGESRGYTFEELDLIEAKMKREDEVEARRLAADDEWADRVVAEQEQLEARKAAEAAKRPPVASVSAKEEECRRFAVSPPRDERCLLLDLGREAHSCTPPKTSFRVLQPALERTRDPLYSTAFSLCSLYSYPLVLTRAL